MLERTGAITNEVLDQLRPFQHNPPYYQWVAPCQCGKISYINEELVV